MRTETPTAAEQRDDEPRALPSGMPSWPWLATWAVIGVGSLVVRAVVLDRAALSPTEAAYTFASWQASRGLLDESLVDFGAPLLTYLTTVIFFLLGGSDAAARVVPLLAGVGFALAPALLAPTVGARAAVAAGVLIALSPIAVQLSRVADPASTCALFAALAVASAIRLFTDRPAWAPWLLAISVGLGLVSAGGFVIALVTAAVAALATWSVNRAQVRAWGQALATPTGRYALLAGALVALVAGTAGFMDLRGLGFAVGDVWGRAAGIMAPAPFPSRNLAALLVYAGPLILLALAGVIPAARRGDRIALFLGEWSLLLAAIAIAFGQTVLTLALLPIFPLALLAGLAVASLPTSASAYRLSGAACAIIALALALGGVVLLVFAHTLGGGAREASPVAFVAAILAIALVAFLWRQEIPASERMSALTLLGAGLLAAVTIGSIGRLSYGGSPVGTEILVRQETSPALREYFHEQDILAMGNRDRVLGYTPTTPIEVRWYGRYIQQVPVEQIGQRTGLVFREAPPLEANPSTTDRGRLAWTTISQLDRSDLQPLSILRWIVSRGELVQGQARDLVLAR